MDAPDLEALAREMQVPLDDVAQLYAREFATLAAGARITSFLPILATRKVRTLLRQRCHPRATPAAAQAPTPMPSRAGFPTKLLALSRHTTSVQAKSYAFALGSVHKM
jgi:hypothetical protein